MFRLRIFLITFLLLVFVSPSHATIPLSLLSTEEGELPSLAPMLIGVQPAIVNISTTTNARTQKNPFQNNPFLNDPFFRRFFNTPRQQQRPQQRPIYSLGSGVIVDAENGYVITNHHLVGKAEKITVTTYDGSELDAELVGSDVGSDIALIKVQGDNLTDIKLGVSEKVQVGDFVVAIGSPFGLSQSVTSGIISALGRSGLGIESYEDFIQTDASINPGNSGGALVNLRGELIGINTAILSRSGGSVGIGLAIPVDMVKSLMPQLIKYGAVARGLLGVSIQDLTPALAKGLGISGKKGAFVMTVAADSAAEDEGIEAGDVIVKFNNTRIERGADLRNAVGLLRPGSSAVVKYYRDGELKSVDVEIRAKESESFEFVDLGISQRLDGARFKTVKPVAGFGKDFNGGVRVVEVDVDSPAAILDFKKDDVIIAINGEDIVSTEQMREVLQKAEDEAVADNILRIKLVRNERVWVVVIQ